MGRLRFALDQLYMRRVKYPETFCLNHDKYSALKLYLLSLVDSNWNDFTESTDYFIYTGVRIYYRTVPK